MIWNKNLTRDPICGMKQMPGKGIEKDGKWYCSDKCLKEMDYRLKSHQQDNNTDQVNKLIRQVN